MDNEIDYPFDEDLRTQEEKTFLEDDSAELPPNDIVAYNELRSCADIVRMYKNNQLTNPTRFSKGGCLEKARANKIR